MNDFFSNLMLASLISIIVSLLLIIHAFFRKKRYRPRLIFAGVSLGIFLFAAIGYTTTLSPEQRAEMEQKRIAKQAQEAQEKAEKEEKKAQEAAEKKQKAEKEAAEKNAQKAQRDAEKKQKDEQKAAEKKQKAEQDAKAKEQAAADAAAQKVYDDQAKYEAWLKSAGVIGTVPGLGDRISEFEKKHKLSHGSSMPKAYDNDRFTVLADDRIEHMTIEHLRGNKIDPVISQMTPADGNEISAFVDDSDPLLAKHISIGHSDTLDIVLPTCKGYYTRMDVYDVPTGDYLYTILYTGNYDDPDTF